MKQIDIFNEDGTIDKKLTVGMYVGYSFEVEPDFGRPYVETGEGYIIEARYDTKYNDRECDEYIIQDKYHDRQEIYGRDVNIAYNI